MKEQEEVRTNTQLRVIKLTAPGNTLAIKHIKSLPGPARRGRGDTCETRRAVTLEFPTHLSPDTKARPLSVITYLEAAAASVSFVNAKEHGYGSHNNTWGPCGRRGRRVSFRSGQGWGEV